ncbi:MAG: hypothetical protein QXL96_00685 [Ignisphaera sp.]
MICITLTKNVPLVNADKITAIAVQQARLEKNPYINLVFLTNSAYDVFRYREVFTKYIDIGVRVYTENSLERFKKILLENCKELYVSISDEEALKILENLGIGLKVHII